MLYLSCCTMTELQIDNVVDFINASSLPLSDLLVKVQLAAQEVSQSVEQSSVDLFAGLPK